MEFYTLVLFSNLLWVYYCASFWFGYELKITPNWKLRPIENYAQLKITPNWKLRPIENYANSFRPILCAQRKWTEGVKNSFSDICFSHQKISQKKWSFKIQLFRGNKMWQSFLGTFRVSFLRISVWIRFRHFVIDLMNPKFQQISQLMLDNRDAFLLTNL